VLRQLIGKQIKECLMNIKLDRVSGSAILILAIYLIVHVLLTLRLGNRFQPGSGYVPLLLALLLAILGTVILIKNDFEKPLRSVQWTGYNHILIIMGCCIFAVFAFEKIGYRITTSVILIVLFGFLERVKIWITIILTIGLSFGSFWLFYTVLNVPLPLGIF
jgi:hypothetical protein